MKIHKVLSILFVVLSITACSVYNFTGTGKIDANTFQVVFFQNNAPLIEPGIERTFTTTLRDLIQNQTNLSPVTSNADLTYEGEITSYTITPMTATASQTASQNRLTIVVNVRFKNKNKETENFEKAFEFFYDYPASTQLTGTTLTTAITTIYERITQNVFSESLAKW
jgi:hypothetical protein